MSSIDVIGKEKGIAIQAYIRVAIVPVGNINASTFKKYASLIQKCEEVPLIKLTRYAEDNKRSPFLNMNWKENKMRFYFVDGANISTQFTEIQQYRKVHAVIGIMSCLSESKVNDGYEKYLAIKKQFSTEYSVPAGRCFAVEPLEDQKDVVDIKDLIMIPNQDLRHLEFYIASQFNDLALDLLRSFESSAAHPKQLLSLASIVSDSGKRSYAADPNAQKKETIRKNKIFGDYALLSGDFAGAALRYQSAIDIARTIPDELLFHAGCIEGLAAAIYIRHITLSGITLDATIIQEISQKYEDAITQYAKSNVKELHVESLLRFAHFNANCGDHSRRLGALDSVTRAYECSSQLTTQEKILVSGYAARICYSMGLKRKFGFFLRETAQLHNQLCNQSVSMRLGSLCLDSYCVPIEMRNSEWVVRQEEKSMRGWQKLQLKLLKDLISFAKSMSPADYLTEAQLMLFMLCNYYDVLRWQDQSELFERFIELSKKVSSNVGNISLVPLPILKLVDPQKLAPHLEPIEHKEEDEQKNSIFIFSPFDRQSSSTISINWVQNEMSKVELLLHNPFQIDLAMKRLSLRIRLETGECEVYDTKAILRAGRQEKFEIIVKPLGSGKLFIEAVEVEFEKCFLKDPLIIPIVALKKMVNNEEKSIEITVLEKIPLLNIHVPSPSITLFDGESISSTLTLQNISSNPIEKITASFDNKTLCKLRIDETSIAESLPLNPNGQTIHATLYIDGKWNGDQHNTISVKLKYFGFERKWYREVSIPIQLLLMRGLFLDKCLSVNEQYGREIVAKLHNDSPFPFVLLSSNDKEKQERKQSEVNIMERHKNVDWKQFVQGIPMPPGSSKMIVVGSHILHQKQGETTTETFRIPYSANINEYTEEIASRMKWKSYMNTYGTVGSGVEIKHEPVQTFFKKKEEVVPEVKKIEEDLKICVELGNSDEKETLKMDNFDKDIIRTTPPTYQVPVGSSQLLTWALHRQAKHKKVFKVTVQVYQDAPNGTKVVVAPEQFAYAGLLSMNLHNFEQDASRLTTTTTITTADREQVSSYEHSVQLFFLEEGYYNLSVECTEDTGSDDVSPQMLAKPLQIIVHCR